jgi:acetyl-CoA acetyltransferase
MPLIRGRKVGDQGSFRDRAAIAGVGSTRQGVHEVDGFRLAVDAFKDALEDGGIDKSEIDGVLTAKQFDGTGIGSLEFSQLVGISPRVTGALDYGTGGFTTQYAAFLVATGVCEVVACVYGRNPSAHIGELSGAHVISDLYGYTNAAALPAMGWTEYMAKYGGTEETLGHIAVTERENARRNPKAAHRDPLTLDDYLATPYLIWPLRLLDIATITGGAVAVIVTTLERARRGAKKAVRFEAVGRQQTPRRLETDGYFLSHPMSSVADQVYGAAGLEAGDMDVLAISDASTVAVVQTLENYGFCGEGEAGDFVASGAIDHGGSIPVNPDGGQLSGGYLVGWLHQVELVRQLRGEAEERQVSGAEVGQYCTTGGNREHYLSTIYRID